MANMALGTYTFNMNPSDITPFIKPDKINASTLTYSDVAYFSWPPSIVGKKFTLTWTIVSAAQFDTMDAIFQADLPVVWNPNNEYGYLYTVQITKCDAVYYEKWTTAFEGDTDVLRKNAVLELLVLQRI